MKKNTNDFVKSLKEIDNEFKNPEIYIPYKNDLWNEEMIREEQSLNFNSISGNSIKKNCNNKQLFKK